MYTPPHPTTSWNAQPHQLICAPLSQGCRESGGVPMHYDTMHAPPSFKKMYLMYLTIIITLLLQIPISYHEDYGTVCTCTRYRYGVENPNLRYTHAEPYIEAINRSINSPSVCSRFTHFEIDSTIYIWLYLVVLIPSLSGSLPSVATA